MKTFFQSGMAFLVIALLCFAAAAISEKALVFVGVSAFWLVMAIVVRAKNAKKQPTSNEAKP